MPRVLEIGFGRLIVVARGYFGLSKAPLRPYRERKYTSPQKIKCRLSEWRSSPNCVEWSGGEGTSCCKAVRGRFTRVPWKRETTTCFCHLNV